MAASAIGSRRRFPALAHNAEFAPAAWPWHGALTNSARSVIRTMASAWEAVIVVGALPSAILAW
jgi:hypothetical protein